MNVKELKKLDDLKLAGMLSFKIKDKIYIYGGSNFPDKLPPFGEKKVYNDIYILDEKFNILEKKKGKIFPNYGINILDNEILWYILDNKLYKIYLEEENLIEEEYLTLPESFDSGFAAILGNKLVFGKENVYVLYLENKKIDKVSKFPGLARSQSVYFLNENYLYILGGASNICHLDSYRLNLENYFWERIEDIPVSFTGAAFCKLDNGNVLIVGGFNKEIYDEVVPKLSDLSYKEEYFKLPKEYFKWNENLYIFNSKSLKIEKKYKSSYTSLCGSGLIYNNDICYLILGEYKPGFRSSSIYSISLD